MLPSLCDIENAPDRPDTLISCPNVSFLCRQLYTAGIPTGVVSLLRLAMPACRSTSVRHVSEIRVPGDLKCLLLPSLAMSVAALYSQLNIALGPHRLMESGQPLKFDASAASAYMKSAGEVHGTVRVEVSIGSGAYSALAWGCDLTYDYVKINADYTT